MKKTLIVILILFLPGLGLLSWKGHPYAEMAIAYKAKTLCAAAFLSGRDIRDGRIEDVAAGDLAFLQMFQTKKGDQSVSVSLLGLHRRTAVFREGIGTTLALGKSVDQLLAEKRPVAPPQPLPDDRLWPLGNKVDTSQLAPEIDSEKLQKAMDFAFRDPEGILNTRAVVVVYDGRIVAENFAQGFGPDMRLKGWSMAKSITNALVGIMVRQGKLRLEETNLLDAWRGENDPRAAINLSQMLRMSSGIDFNETYSVDPVSDISMMLFRTGNASKYAATKPQEHPPGSFFEYASATSNLLCRVIREKIDDDATYHAFPYRELFHKIGANSAILERDASGTFIGSSFIYANPRDWARLGLLFANDGVWNGERILPEGWVDYSRTPAPAAKNGEYGAHFWLKFGNSDGLPEGILHMSGHEGQCVSVLPENKLVVVRLGLTLETKAWDQEKFIAEILKAL